MDSVTPTLLFILLLLSATDYLSGREIHYDMKNTIGTKIVSALALNNYDDSNSRMAKSMVMRAYNMPHFIDLLMNQSPSQVMWIDENAGDGERDVQTISSFLRTLNVIKEIYVQEGWLDRA